MKRLEQDVTPDIRVKRLIESEDSHFVFSLVTRNQLKIREHLLMFGVSLRPRNSR